MGSGGNAGGAEVGGGGMMGGGGMGGMLGGVAKSLGLDPKGELHRFGAVVKVKLVELMLVVDWMVCRWCGQESWTGS